MPFAKGQNRVYIFSASSAVGPSLSTTSVESEEFDGWDLASQGTVGDFSIALIAEVVQTSTSSPGTGNFQVRLEENIVIEAVPGQGSSIAITNSYGTLGNWVTARSCNGDPVTMTKRNPMAHAQIIRGARYRLSVKGLALAEQLEVRIACN